MNEKRRSTAIAKPVLGSGGADPVRRSSSHTVSAAH